MTVPHSVVTTAAGGPLAAYHAALAEGRFLLQCCTACGRFVFHPRTLCPHCGSSDLDWQPPSGLGTVYAVTVVARRPEKGGPYNVVLVDLDEGIRLMSRVETAADVPHIGQRVRAMIVREADAPLLVFQPIEDDCDGAV